MTIKRNLITAMGLTALMATGVANASGNGSVTVGMVQTTIDSAHLHDPTASATSTGFAVEWVPGHFLHHYGYGVSANTGTDEGNVYTAFLEGSAELTHSLKAFAKVGAGYASGPSTSTTHTTSDTTTGTHAFSVRNTTTTDTTATETTDTASHTASSSNSSTFTLVGVGLSYSITHSYAITASAEYTSTKATTALVGLTYNY